MVSSESIEQNDNDLKVNAVAYAFAKIFQPETCDQELHSSSFVDFPSGANWETKKSTFSTVEDFAQFW